MLKDTINHNVKNLKTKVNPHLQNKKKIQPYVFLLFWVLGNVMENSSYVDFVKRVLGYLKAIADLSIMFKKTNIEEYVDSL